MIARLLFAIWIINKPTKFLAGDKVTQHSSWDRRCKLLSRTSPTTFVWRCSSHNCLLSTPARPPAAGHDDKLLSVCAEFAAYMQNLTDCAEDFIEDIKRFEDENDAREKFYHYFVVSLGTTCSLTVSWPAYWTGLASLDEIIIMRKCSTFSTGLLYCWLVSPVWLV